MKISHPKYVLEKQQIGVIEIDNRLMDDFCQNLNGSGVRVDYDGFDKNLQQNRYIGSNTNTARMNEDTFTRLTIICALRGYEVFIEELDDEEDGR